MRVKILKHGDKPLEIQGFDQLVVETDGGAPVAVVSRYGPEGCFLVSSRDDDPRFERVLKELGLQRAVVVTDLKDIMDR